LMDQIRKLSEHPIGFNAKKKHFENVVFTTLFLNFSLSFLI
jgi:hypothetical protein